VISPAVFQVLRSSAQDCDTFAEFLSLCYTLFWILLRSAQDEAKKLFSFQSKEQAVKLFDELQSSARNDALHDDAYQALTLAIRNTAAEVHRQLDSMTEWLTRAEGEQATLVFELAQAVNIAVQSALNSQTGFTPKITFDIEDSVEVPPPTLVWLSEIFSVIINNACSKSQSGVHPTIAIKCGLNEDRDVLLIEVVNSLGKSLDAVAIEAKLTVIRNRIAAGDIQRGASVEGGSGLLKVAQLTQRASKSYLEFGITANGRFRTMVALEIQTTDGSVALVQVS
jgi:hypothetical protein